MRPHVPSLPVARTTPWPEPPVQYSTSAAGGAPAAATPGEDGEREHDRDGFDQAGTVAFSEPVLDQQPTPIVVVDLFGTIVYGNAQMASTMGSTPDPRPSTLDEARGCGITEFIHPDDVGWALDAFLALGEAGRTQTDWATEPWAAAPRSHWPRSTST